MYQDFQEEEKVTMREVKNSSLFPQLYPCPFLVLSLSIYPSTLPIAPLFYDLHFCMEQYRAVASILFISPSMLH